jgi:hypothetical protein
MEAVRRLAEPVGFSFSLPVRSPSIASSVNLARRQEALYRDLERAVGLLRSVLSALPSPPRLPRFQREARQAWLHFHQGDPEPLDSFIRKYLVRLENHEGPVPDNLRQRVMGVLDELFAPVLVYAPGDWYSFKQAAQDKLVDFARATRNKFGSVSYIANLEDVLPGATLEAWEDTQVAAGSSTLLNYIDQHLRDEADDGPSLLRQAEKRPHLFLPESTENPLALFEAQEAMLQQLEVLPRLIDKAAFSPKEHVVYEYDSRVGTDFKTIVEATEAAANHLNRSREDVRSLRFRRRKKLRDAVASDPWFQNIFKEIAPDL